MKKLPFTIEDYKTMAIFIFSGLGLFCLGYLNFPTTVEEIFNFLKISGAACLIITLLLYWDKYYVIQRNAFLLAGIGIMCWGLLHAYKVIITHQSQSYVVNMGFHLTVLTAYVGFVFTFIKKVANG